MDEFADAIGGQLVNSMFSSCDGIVLKSPCGPYDFGMRRVRDGWLKVKHDTLNIQFVDDDDNDNANGKKSIQAPPSPPSAAASASPMGALADTLDLVVLGA